MPKSMKSIRLCIKKENKMEKISIVVPCYNEEKNINNFYEEMIRILVVNKSGIILQRTKNHVTIIKLQKAM